MLFEDLGYSEKCISYKKINPGSGSPSLQLSSDNVNDRFVFLLHIQRMPQQIIYTYIVSTDYFKINLIRSISCAGRLVLYAVQDLLCGSKVRLQWIDLMRPQKEWQPATGAHVEESADSQFVNCNLLNRGGGRRSLPSSIKFQEDTCHRKIILTRQTPTNFSCW